MNAVVRYGLQALLYAAFVVAVGYFIHWLVPSIPLAVAFVLGAIVSPTDAVATVATTARPCRCLPA